MRTYKVVRAISFVSWQIKTATIHAEDPAEAIELARDSSTLWSPVPAAYMPGPDTLLREPGFSADLLKDHDLRELIENAMLEAE